MQEFARTLSDQPTPETDAAFNRALTAARALEDPVLAGVADPISRIRVEALQNDVLAIAEAVSAEIAPALGVTVGFNSADGD